MRLLSPDVTTATLDHEPLPGDERITVAPGVAVRLTAGEHTVWAVTERVRTVWVARRSRFGHLAMPRARASPFARRGG